MTILVTGVSGLDRDRTFSQLPGGTSTVDIGKQMLFLAKELRMSLDENNILHAGRDTLAALRTAAIERILRTKEAGTKLVLSAHSVFSRLDGLVEGLSLADLNILAPKLWITLIDGPQVIEDRLRAHKAEYFHLTVWDIVKWQELEVFLSNHLAASLGIRHYVVPTGEATVFSDLCSCGRMETAYASYPMSHATETAKTKINTFITRLKKHFIVFDPGAIESSHGTKPHHTERDRQAIGSHTIVRDLDWFIRINADSVIAYWPETIFSSGMSDELRYAFEIGRRTVLVTERREEGGLPLLSPFLTYKASVFWSSREYFEFLDLPATNRNCYSICQQVMLEQARLHASGVTELTKAHFVAECKRIAEHRLSRQEEITGEMIEGASGLVFDSWQALILRRTFGSASTE